MKKILFCILMLPFFVFADDITKDIKKFEKDIFAKGVLAGGMCHSYYTLGELLFDLNESGDTQNLIPKIRKTLGNKLTDSILNYAKSEKDYMKRSAFLTDLHLECIQQTIATGEAKQPKFE